MLGAVLLTAEVIDWAQTRYIARHPVEYYEHDPTMGPHPSIGRVNAYFAASVLSAAFIANALPSKYRKWFLGTAAVWEIEVIGCNRSVGIKLQF